MAGAGILTALFAAYAFRFRRFSIIPPFIGLLAATSIYCLSYALELSSADFEGMLFWSKIGYLGIPAIPFFWLLLAARYSGRDRALGKPVLIALGALSAATALARWTDGWHHLFYGAIAVNRDGPFPVLAFQKGPLYWVFQAYSNVVVLLGIVWLLRMLSQAPRAFRRQTLMLLLGAIVPWAVLVVYLSGGAAYGIDPNPFGLSLMGTLVAVGLFRHGVLDVVPVARKTIIASMGDGVIVLDEKNRIIEFNPAAAEIFPSLSAKLYGRRLEEAATGQPAIFDLLDGSLAADAEFRIERDGTRRDYIARVSEVCDRGRRTGAKVLLLNNATERVRLREQLRLQAITDDLTGIFNRRHFFERAALELLRAKRGGQALSILILDLDRFKRVNDTRGHEAGDRVLRAVCDLFRAVLRATDLIGRHGGEEFVILLPETPPLQACTTAERLRAAVAGRDFSVSEEAAVRITVSIGVAGTNRASDETVEDLVRTADRAMYAAKNAGRDCVRCAAETPPEPAP